MHPVWETGLLSFLLRSRAWRSRSFVSLPHHLYKAQVMQQRYIFLSAEGTTGHVQCGQEKRYTGYIIVTGITLKLFTLVYLL